MKHKNCPACGQSIEITSAMAGTTILCPHCKHGLKVPPLPLPPTPPVAPPSGPMQNDAPVGPSSVVVDVKKPLSPDMERYRKRKSSRQLMISASVCIMCFAVAAAIMFFNFPSSKSSPLQPPRFAEVQDLRAVDGASISQPLHLVDAAKWEGKVSFELVEGPTGASVDPRSGTFAWKPASDTTTQRQQVTVLVRAQQDPQAFDSASFWVTAVRKNSKPTMTLPTDLQVVAGKTLQATIEASDPDQPPSPLLFSLSRGPSGATLNAQTGELQWTPPVDTPAGNVLFTIEVREDQKEGLSVRGQFRVRITQPDRPIDPVVTALRDLGSNTSVEPSDFEHPFGGTGAILRVEGEEIRFFEYATEQAVRGDTLKVAKDRTSLQMPKLPDSWVGPVQYFHKGMLLFVYAGLNQEVVAKLTKVLGEPLASSKARTTASAIPELGTSATASTPSPVPAGTFSDDEVAQLVALHQNGQLFRPRNYSVLRNIFAAQFRRDHATLIETAFGADTELRQWLRDHADIEEELFTAIDPEVDNVAECLRLFRELQQTFPDVMETYSNLAIAIAVTWDNRKATEMHLGPMRQGKGVAPDNPAGAEDNFAYFVQNERVMQGRAQLLPWEFLTHVVNHTTPLIERQWVLENYLSKRVMYGTCYKTVPYDTEMLDSKNQVGRIHGRAYTLPNLLQYGGVCAHQADFAARVGKSLGIPAAYVSGESTYGANHAWVMWVELKSVTPGGIGFTLESHGRYLGDKYYVGRLREPQSGKAITDRQLELQLHTVGVSATVKRQADWVMGAFATIQQQQSLSIVQQFLYLRDTLNFCPSHEQAWIALSKMSNSPEVREKHRKEMTQILDQLFITFARFPDFTWTIFDDLIAFQETLDKRIALYGRLVSLYELQGRPDLACEARLRLADMLVENLQTEDAITGLAFSIKKFPSEGRYVPRMLDRLEAICVKENVAQEHLVPFYHSFLPMIPQMRGSRPSQYCIQMFERGINRFQEAGQTQLVQLYSAQLQRIRAGQGVK